MYTLEHNKNNIAVTLLVEDNIADQQLTVRAFKKGKINTNLQIVNDGQEAMDYLLGVGKYSNQEEYPWPDLILLDINMPKKDGKQVLKEIRQHPDLKTIPVVMLTTSDQENDVLDSYKFGANSYITKPVRINDFIDVVNKLEEFWFTLSLLPPKKQK
ncbi:MAG: response regulator [Bacteroidales bacterium]|nr:response regulator [Bacteroidales bacterium]MBN2756958.1 response regulator [Bacteroidales bacterium]